MVDLLQPQLMPLQPQHQEVGTCVLTQMASILTQRTVRNITSVPMGLHMSIPVHQAFCGMMLSNIVIGLQMFNAPWGQPYPHPQHQPQQQPRVLHQHKQQSLPKQQF